MSASGTGRPGDSFLGGRLRLRGPKRQALVREEVAGLQRAGHRRVSAAGPLVWQDAITARQRCRDTHYYCSEERRGLGQVRGVYSVEVLGAAGQYRPPPHGSWPLVLALANLALEYSPTWLMFRGGGVGLTAGGGGWTPHTPLYPGRSPSDEPWGNTVFMAVQLLKENRVRNPQQTHGHAGET